MNITVTFETIAEVKAFAEMITGPAVKEGKSSQNTAVTPVTTVQPSFKTETAPVLVQNASAVPVHNSPAAPVQNVSAAPVTPVQGAPTAPVQTAPIHTALQQHQFRQCRPVRERTLRMIWRRQPCS